VLVYFAGQSQFIYSRVTSEECKVLTRDKSHSYLFLVKQNKHSPYRSKELSVVLIFPRNIAGVICETSDSLYNATARRVSVYLSNIPLRSSFTDDGREFLCAERSVGRVRAVLNTIIIINI